MAEYEDGNDQLHGSAATAEKTKAADRGRDTTRALTEVRTVLSRAETALDTFRRGPTENRYNSDGKPDFDGEGNWPRDYDPDHTEMVEALEKVAGILDRWRRTGRPRAGASDA